MKKIIAILLVSLVLFTAGCSSGVSQEKYDSLVEDYEDSLAQIEQLEKQVKELKSAKNDASDPSDKKDSDGDENPILLVDQQATGTQYGYSHASFTVKNNSNQKIHTLTLNIKILDKNGVILSTTHPQDSAMLNPGESIIIDALTKEGAHAMKLDGYSFYTGTDFDGDYIQGHFDSADELILN